MEGRGVDAAHFRPGPRDAFPDLPRPIFLSVGRVAREKNLDAFLSLDLPGSKVVVGAGPDEARLRKAYPQAHFTGMQADDKLPAYYSAADVFVFPSLTDTFGLVMLEAMACGTPVAAFPVDGPLDVVGASDAGVLDHDLASASLKALKIARERARARALTFDWDSVCEEFLGYLVPTRRQLRAPEPCHDSVAEAS